MSRPVRFAWSTNSLHQCSHILARQRLVSPHPPLRFSGLDWGGLDESLSKYPAPLTTEVFIELQDHNHPGRHRNIWIRSLGETDRP